MIDGVGIFLFGIGELWAAWAGVALLVLGYAWVLSLLFPWTSRPRSRI